MSEADIRASLFNWKGASTGAELPADLRTVAVDQYKLYLDFTDRLSQRRQTVSSFFVTVNTAAVGVLGYANVAPHPAAVERPLLLVPAAGLILCLLWWRTIRSYRDLNRARFAVIYAMETVLPLKPYTAEWDYVGRGQSSELYKPVSSVEALVPGLFALLFGLVIAWNLFGT